MPTTNGVKSNKLAIYLIKPEHQALADIVDSGNEPVPIEGVGHFIFADSYTSRPGWLAKFFAHSLDDDLHIFSASAKGVLIVPLTKNGATHRFALTFGVGRHLLKEGVIEERFGLKVALNSVEQGHLRSIVKTTLGSVPKHSREQMSRDVTAAEFGIDIEQDLVAEVTAKSHDERLGKIITGKDALSVSVKVDVTNITSFLAHCYDRYQSDDYKNDFDWIDQIKEVRSKRREDGLNAQLVAKLAERSFEKIWMAVPEVIDWADLRGFRYCQAKRAELQDDLDIGKFLDSLGDEPLTIEQLKQKYVHMISAKDDQVTIKWPAFRCVYAELELDGRLHVLNGGKWYEIAANFTEQVCNEYASIQESTIALPDCASNDEYAYNQKAAAEVAGLCCMDRQTVVHGGGHSKIEFCDLLSEDKHIIHVKRYGASSVLSHLFNQGIVSGELFVSDSGFRHKLNEKLPADYSLAAPDNRPNAAEHEIVYAIISNVPTPLDIPFFSKVSLRNARRRLESYGYRVTIKKIQKIGDDAS